jgi:hypothetical protein
MGCQQACAFKPDAVSNVCLKKLKERLVSDLKKPQSEKVLVRLLFR